MKKVLFCITVLLSMSISVMTAQEREKSAQRIVPAGELQARVDTLYARYNLKVSFDDMNNVTEDRIKLWEDYAFLSDWNAHRNDCKGITKEQKFTRYTPEHVYKNLTKEQMDSLRKEGILRINEKAQRNEEAKKSQKTYSPEETMDWIRNVTDSLRVEYNKSMK